MSGPSDGRGAETGDPLCNQTLDGRLHIVRPIGQGGMGTVYVARHIGLDRRVAVKVLHSDFAAQDGVVTRLHTEARHTAAVRSPHIVEVFDIGQLPDGRPYIVMELLDGESLAQRLARLGGLSVADTLHIGRQLAEALAAAHRAGIVHRDLKPENVFLCPSPRGGSRDHVKLLDFGISKVLVRGERDVHLTRSGAGSGTPLYMSPEQVRGDRIDHRIDIYALGVVLYECLTGSVPFFAESSLAVAARIVTEPPEPPSQRCAERGIRPELEQLVLRALEKEPAARYATLDELLVDLARCTAGLPLLAVRHRPAVLTRGVSGLRAVFGRASQLGWGPRPLRTAALLSALLVLIGVPVQGLLSRLSSADVPSRRSSAGELSKVRAQSLHPTLEPLPRSLAPVQGLDQVTPPTVTPATTPIENPPARPRPRPLHAPSERASRPAVPEALPEAPQQDPLLEEQAPNPFVDAPAARRPAHDRSLVPR